MAIGLRHKVAHSLLLRLAVVPLAGNVDVLALLHLLVLALPRSKAYVADLVIVVLAVSLLNVASLHASQHGFVGMTQSDKETLLRVFVAPNLGGFSGSPWAPPVCPSLLQHS